MKKYRLLLCRRLCLHARRRIISPAQWLDLVRLGSAAVLALIFVWFAVAVWPAVPVIVIGLFGLLGAGGYLLPRVALRAERRLPHRGNHIVVRPVTRDEWRRDRWARTQQARTIVITLISTAVVTFIATVAATDQLPAWLR